ncbi:MAG: glycosyltransferase family 4 protein [Candidatus Electrothrix sp. YB6]
MATKVFHLTSVHPVFDTRIFHKQCVSLAEAGYDVTLLASGCEEQYLNGVKIRSVLKEKNRVARMLKTPWNLYRKIVKSNAEICHFHDPELIPVGVLLRLHGKKVIYDVHEDYPGSILDKFWLPFLLRKPASLITACVEWIGSRFFFTGIIVVTSTIAKRFPVQKTILVQNLPKLQELLPPQNKEYKKRIAQLAYIGGLAEIRSIIEIMQAMSTLSHNECRLILAGRFSNIETEKKCRQHNGWEKVEYKGWVSRRDVASLLSDVRAGLVLFHPLPNHVAAQPNKLFEYMSAGIPVIASDFPLWRKIIDGAQCGLLVDPLQPKSIAEAIDWLLDHPEEAEQMGKNGRKAVVERYNWETESKKLLDVYSKLNI